MAEQQHDKLDDGLREVFDGFGNSWNCPHGLNNLCRLNVVRPGKVQCPCDGGVEGLMREIQLTEELHAREIAAIRPETGSMKGRTFDAPEQPCQGCGKPLLIDNAWMDDGCPCNTPAGVNNLNLYRWRLLHELQQRQYHEKNALSEHLERMKAKVLLAADDEIMRQESARSASGPTSVEACIRDAWDAYQRFGCVTEFEGQPLIYAAVLEEIFRNLEEGGTPVPINRKDSTLTSWDKLPEQLAPRSTIGKSPEVVAAAAAEDYKDRYLELLYAVARKFPGETRHETALRYIQQAESGGSTTASAIGRSE